jgi:predicted AAA+ superfamily ATPase
MKRVYESLLGEHLREHRQMVFLTGPRQVGKTTTARASAGKHEYLTWDRQSDRMLFTAGPDRVAERLGLADLSRAKKRIVFDELHKYRRWKSFLKGFFDIYSDRCSLVVTGSARLNVYKRGGDSLMGRYFPYRMHPLSLGELVRSKRRNSPVVKPVRVPADAVEQLLSFGGFPEPFLRASDRFYNRWRRLRSEQLFREDLRDLTRIQEMGQVEVLAELLAARAGQLLNYSSLSADTNAAAVTVQRWIDTLERLYYCFLVRPWFRNVPKSLRKQPKVYLWDWSLLTDPGARLENFVASHLLKSVYFWTDAGLGDFALHFLRDKAGREVDFLVTRDRKPWFLVEVKSSEQRQVSPALTYFQAKTGAAHAFQLAPRMSFVETDAFGARGPVRVPMTTLLSQLV